jgi:hypothetical protein
LFAEAANVTVSDPVAPVVDPDVALTFDGADGAPTITVDEGADAGPAPRELVAFTVHVYDLPMLRPVTVSGPAAPELVPLRPVFDDTHVAANDVIAAPLFTPATNATTSDPPAPVSIVTPVGAAGAPTTTGGDAADGAPVPTAFAAVTLHAYDFPVVVPETVIGLALADTARVAPPFDDVHVAR